MVILLMRKRSGGIWVKRLEWTGGGVYFIPFHAIFAHFHNWSKSTLKTNFYKHHTPWYYLAHYLLLLDWKMWCAHYFHKGGCILGWKRCKLFQRRKRWRWEQAHLSRVGLHIVHLSLVSVALALLPNRLATTTRLIIAPVSFLAIGRVDVLD